MMRTVVRLVEDQGRNPVFFLDEPRSYDRAATQYRLLFPVMTLTAAPNSDELDIPRHGLAAGQEVAVMPLTRGDSLPPGLTSDRAYYVVVVDADRIKLAASPGGAPVEFRAAGPWQCVLFAWAVTDKLRTTSTVAGSTAAVRDVGDALLKGLRRHPAIQRSLEGALEVPMDSIRPLCLFFDQATQPVVESFPWEALHDDAKRFLALDRRWPIVRFKDPQSTIIRTFAYEPPLRILAVLSATGPNVDATFEWRGLYAAIKGRDVYVNVLTCQPELIREINGLDSWRFSAEQVQDSANVHTQIRKFTPQIVHLFGHGDPKSSALLFGTLADWKLEHAGSIRLLGKELQQHVSSNAVPVWLAVLNACRSAAAIGGPESLASTLARNGLPVVIGMSTEVASEYARVFTEQYYTWVMNLIASVPVGKFTEIDWASGLWATRVAIRDASNMNPEQCPYWTIPVVYTRMIPFEIIRTADDEPGRPAPPLPESTVRLTRAQTYLNTTDPRLATEERFRDFMHSP